MPTDNNTLGLPAAAALDPADELDIVQDVATTPEDRHTPLSDLLAWIVAQFTWADAADVDTGTAVKHAIDPDVLAASNIAERVVVFCLNGTAALTTADMAQFRVPSSMNGMNLVEIAGHCGKDGASGAPAAADIVISIQNGTTNMLSVNMKIETGEYDTSTSATPGTIDAAHDEIATGNVVNVEVVSTGTGATYVEIVCVFRLP